jgi:putative transposase
VLKTYEYRLYPTRVQRGQLLSCLAESRRLYNEMLEMVKAHYEETGIFLSRYDLNVAFKGRGGEHVPQTTVQTLADRLDKALERFFHRTELGRKVGFPRFKGANRWHSIQLRQYGRRRDVYLDPDTGRLRVPKKLGTSIKLKQHRPLIGTPKTAHLVLRADGHWYVLIVCDPGEAPPKREGEAVGIDVGLKVFLADSADQTVKNPCCFERAQKKLRVSQRKAARRKKGSRRKRKAAPDGQAAPQDQASAHRPRPQGGSLLRRRLRLHRLRRPARIEHAQKPPSRQSHSRCELVGIQELPLLQSGRSWLQGGRSSAAPYLAAVL